MSEEVGKMYNEKLMAFCDPQVVQVSFVLHAHDWFELKETDEWKFLAFRLGELYKKYNPQPNLMELFE